MELTAQVGSVEGLRSAESSDHGVLEAVGVLVGAGVGIDLEVDGSGILIGEPQVDGWWCRSGAVFHGQAQAVVVAAQVQGAVGEGPQIPGAADCLAIEGSVCFAGMVHDDDGDVAAFLQVAETGEKSRDLLCVIFIDIVEPDQGIEKQPMTAATQAVLSTGQRYQGTWIANHEPLYTYEREGNLLFGKAFVDTLVAPASLWTARVTSMVVDAEAVDFERLLNQILPQRRQALKVQLVDGREFEGFHGYLVDYCGHWSATTWHERMSVGFRGLEFWAQDSVSAAFPEALPLEQIAEIEFTGRSGRRLPSCREVVLRLKNGDTRSVFLELTSESYGGVERHDGFFRSLDSVFVLQEDGGVRLGLNWVKRVVLL